MDSVIRVKEWISEHAPMLAKVYENKYAGMLYDRFASLPPKQQRQVLLGGFGGIGFLMLSYLAIQYYSLYSMSSSTRESYRMADMLLQYQKQRRDKSQSIRALSRNTQLASTGTLKQYLVDICRSAQINSKMITADEKPDHSTSEDGKETSEIRGKRATVTLSRVTIVQLMRYMKAIETGQYDLSVSTIRITNDDKLRGYMKVELGVVAYVFSGDEG